MKQTITFHDKRKHSKNRRDDQNLSLKIEQNAKTITVTLEREAGKTETCTFLLEKEGRKAETCAFPLEKEDRKAETCIFPLEKEDRKAETCTFPLKKEDRKAETCTFTPKNSKTDAGSWFDHIETVASDAPLEYSGEHFSVCDLLEDLAADDNAFRILTDALYSMSGLQMTKPLAAMMGDRTLLELVSALDTSVRNGSSPDAPARNDSAPDPAGNSGASRKTPENAMQILNAELNKISKK